MTQEQFSKKSPQRWGFHRRFAYYHVLRESHHKSVEKLE